MSLNERTFFSRQVIIFLTQVLCNTVRYAKVPLIIPEILQIFLGTAPPLSTFIKSDFFVVFLIVLHLINLCIVLRRSLNLGIRL